MSSVLPTDKVLVQRGTALHSAPADMSTVQDTDLLLINRAGVDYKCSVADWKASQSKPPAIASVTLADSPEAGRFTSGTFRSTVVMTDEGIPASTKGIKAYVQGTLKTQAKSSAITQAEVVAQPDWATMTTGGGGWAIFTSAGVGSGTQAATVTFVPPLQVNSSLVIDQWFWAGFHGGSNNLTNYDIKINGTSVPHTFPYTKTGPFTLNTVYYLPATMSGSTTLSGCKIIVDGIPLVAKQSSTKLHFATDADLANFASGDAITEVTAAGVAGDATGTVGGADATAKTITLSATAGTWDVGSAVKGPLKTSVVTTTPQSDEIVGVATVTKNYLTDATITGITNAANFFDGSTATSATFHVGDAFVMSNIAIPFSTSVEVFSAEGNATAIQARVNGGAWVDCGGSRWVVVSTGATSPMTKLELRAGPTGSGGIVINAWRVDGASPPVSYQSTTLTLKTAKDLANFAAGDAITQGGGGTASGTVGSINTTALTMALATSAGTWGPINAGHYVIGPTKTGPAANVKLFCKLNPTLTVTDLQSADPGYTAVTGAGPYTVTFPATLPTGAAPDVDLPAGTSLTTEVQAVNASATVTKTSNTIVPA